MADLQQSPLQTPLAYASPSAEYAPSGRVSGAGLIALLGVGLLSAAIVGVLLTVLLLNDFRLPDLVVYVAPGVVVGISLSLMVRRTKVRSRVAVVIVAAASAIAVVVAILASLYVVSVYQFRDNTREYFRTQLQQLNPSDRAAYESRIEQALSTPFDNFDRAVLIPDHGRGGLLGFAAALPSDAAGVLIAVGILSIIGATVAVNHTTSVGKPFCEPCGRWYGDAVTLAVLPFDWRNDIIATIQSNDVARMRKMRRESCDADFGVACTSVRRYRCPSCDSLLIDAAIVSQGEHVCMTPRWVEPEMLEALKRPEALLETSEGGITNQDDNQETRASGLDNPVMSTLASPEQTFEVTNSTKAATSQSKSAGLSS